MRDSFLEAESYSRLNSKSAVTLYIQKESMTNTVKVATAVRKVLDTFSSTLDQDTRVLIVSDQSSAILGAIHSVEMTMAFGAALVILVLSLFLGSTLFTRWLSAAMLVLLLAVLVGFFLFNVPLDSSLWIVVATVALVAVAAFFGQKDLYPSFVVALSIPVALFITLTFMYFEKFTLNVITLSGLVLGIGLLVDNSIVVLENFDRLRRALPGLTPQEQVEKAAAQVVSPMIGGTLATVVVFLPFFLLPKQTQILYAGIAFTVMASLLASLFAALSLVPALAARLNMGAAVRGVAGGEVFAQKTAAAARSAARPVIAFLSSVPRFFSPLAAGLMARKRTLIGLAFSAFAVSLALRAVFAINADVWLYLLLVAGVLATGVYLFKDYEKSLRLCLERRGLVLGIVALLFAASAAVFAYRLPKDFMASSEQNEFVVFVELASGVRLDISDRIVKEVEKRIQEAPETKGLIKSISSRVEGWSSKVYVTLVPRSERRFSTQQVIDKLRGKFKDVGEEYDTFIYFSEPRSGKEIFIEVYGYSYETLSKICMRLASEMGKVPQFSDVKVRYRPGQPEATMVLEPQRVALFGFDNKEISETLHAQMRGLRATSFFDKAEEVETIVRISPSQCKTIEQMKALPFITPYGFTVPAEHFSRLSFGLAPSEIWHRNKSRMIQVSASLGSTPLGEAASLCKEIFKKVQFPEEYYADIGGDYDEMVNAGRSFNQAMLVTVLLIFAVLACLFESLSQPFIIMMTVLLSSIGAVAALAFSGSSVTLGVSIGMLMLAGVVVNNGIMLVDRINTVKEKEPGKDIMLIVVESAVRRKRPIFMTTITTVLGLLPMALDRSESAVLWSPLAITVIGGLITSTILTLFVVPCFYITFEESVTRVRAYSKGKLARLKTVNIRGMWQKWTTKGGKVRAENAE